MNDGHLGKRIVVVGMVAMDMIAKSSTEFKPGTSNIGTVSISAGGVGQNMARSLQLLGDSPLLVSVLGRDAAAQYLKQDLESVGLEQTGLIYLSHVKTAVYHATHDSNGEMVAAVNDMSVIDELTPEELLSVLEGQDPLMIVFDANISVACIKALCDFADERSIPVWFNPTSVYKATKIVEAQVVDKITFISPNLAELRVIMAKIAGVPQTSLPLTTDAQAMAWISELNEKGVKNVILTKGEKGIVFSSKNQKIELPALTADIVNVTGAGDSLASGIIHKLSTRLKSGKNETLIEKSDLVFGLQCAKAALECESAVNPNLASLL